MKKVIIRDRTKIPPFNEPARDLRVLNKPLWLYQRDVLTPYCTMEIEVDSFQDIAFDDDEVLIYCDNLFFDGPFIDAFIEAARASGKARRVAFALNDKAIVAHALPLQDGIRREGDVYVADLWYFPRGTKEKPTPLVIDTRATEIGFYNVPAYMAAEAKDLVYRVPLRAFLSVENWVHVLMANSPFGILAKGARMERDLTRPSVQLKMLAHSLLERKQLLSCSALVRVGKNTQIDPTAIIQGPTLIGDNVKIHAGAVIVNSIIGNNVNVMQGTQLLLSVVSDGCYMLFRSALFMSVLMERSTVAQNACLHLCVIGRDSFVGAGTTFTDFNLIPKPLRTMHRGELCAVGRTVMGGCVGHNCRIGADLTIFPCRTVESDSVLVRSDKRAVITKNISYEESDHHHLREGHRHPRLYPRDQ